MIVNIIRPLEIKLHKLEQQIKNEEDEIEMTKSKLKIEAEESNRTKSFISKYFERTGLQSVHSAMLDRRSKIVLNRNSTTIKDASLAPITGNKPARQASGPGPGGDTEQIKRKKIKKIFSCQSENKKYFNERKHIKRIQGKSI